MKYKKLTDYGLKISTGVLLAIALLLTFTVSDYYIFNRIGEFNFFFVLSQWIKKAGLLLLPLAVFYDKKCCSDIAKYVLPVFVIISSFTFGEFFNATAVTPDSSPADLVYANINEFMPKALNIALFYISNALYLAVCALLFVRDGYKASLDSFVWLPYAFLGCMPLNIFENFFDINKIPQDSFLRFKNFTVWHLLAIVALASFTIGSYMFLKRKDRKTQDSFLAAAAIILLIQYHSKDSMVMGDGYNVYHTIFACIPLFICNIGVYIASISVIVRKKVLYAISFFIHAAGALSVFVYFGKDEMSNYGIFCSYSILYFTLTHCLLFALSVMPTALGHYKFKPKDAIIPLLYYFGVIIIASLASALVSSASMSFSFNGYTLQEGEYLKPNYAFTQVNPLPFDLPMVKLTIWKYDLNILYILGLYTAYVAIFYAMNGAYYLILHIRKKLLKPALVPVAPLAFSDKAQEEAAVTEEKTDEEEKLNQ